MWWRWGRAGYGYVSNLGHGTQIRAREGEEVDGLLIANAEATRHASKVATGYQQPTMWCVTAGYAQTTQSTDSGETHVDAGGARRRESPRGPYNYF